MSIFYSVATCYLLNCFQHHLPFCWTLKIRKSLSSYGDLNHPLHRTRATHIRYAIVYATHTDDFGGQQHPPLGGIIRFVLFSFFTLSVFAERVLNVDHNLIPFLCVQSVFQLIWTKFSNQCFANKNLNISRFKKFRHKHYPKRKCPHSWPPS